MYCFPIQQPTLPFLRSDCEHFGMSQPEFPLGEELQADISQHEQMWALYEEFSSGLEQLSEEDWISFRWGLFPCLQIPLTDVFISRQMNSTEIIKGICLSYNWMRGSGSQVT